uniref:CCHC-type domain-containing protein n=1 Tax=Quercus lobata TaxID=97700 RepID=A0A7N2R2I6_QUELO
MLDEANQTIGALRFKNNFLAERTKKLEAELFQVKAQLERTSSAKLDEMLSFQKVAFDKTGLGYDFSSPNIASSSITMFVLPADNVNSKNNESKIEIVSENIDKGKSILGAPPKVEKKETRNPKTKKVNNKKSQPKKPHFCHHCGATGHTCPNCYKWLVTQQSNSMVSFGNQNQFPSSLTPLRDLLKALMFLSNLKGFNSSPSPSDQRFAQRKGSSKVWKEKS